MSFLKQQIGFSSNFAWPFSVMIRNSPTLLLDEILYIFNERNLSKYKFGEIESLKLGTLIVSFCQQNIKFQLKKYRRVIFDGTEEWCKFKENLTCSFKYDMKSLMNFHPTTQKPKYFILMGYFCPKYTKFELKKYRGVIFNDTEQWCKIWINPRLVVSKMAWGIGWTFIRAFKFWKVIHWWDLFVKII